MPTPLWVGLLFALFLTGCTPSGPRALLNGKKHLDSGDYAAAVEELHTAVNLLPGNAAAWNYLGVAYQKARQPENAANAYQRALALNRDLVEAHWNLGMLYLEQGKNDPALSEFTAYTLRRSNSPEGFLKMGAAQLRLGQISAAEHSFAIVLSQDPGNAEAINGQGLARIERNRPRDAVQFFASAIQSKPAYPSATLNLAITAQQYLHDGHLALKYYQSYLALTPRPENWEEVSALANSLEQRLQVASVPPPLPGPQENQFPTESPSTTIHPTNPSPAQPQVVETHPAAAVATHPVSLVKTQSVARPFTNPSVTHTAVPPAVAVIHTPPLVLTQRLANPPPPTSSSNHSPLPPPPLEDNQSANATLPSPANEPDAERAASGPPTFPRYGYQAPARPRPGDRRPASGYFTRARLFEQQAQWLDAMQAYRSAAEMDPSWFEAQYNLGVLSFRLGDYQQALGAYEMALAIEPDSADTRYNFALALKAAGYITDAVNELNRLLARHPDEVRAHLAVGNLYAQKLHDPVQTREHYLKVLDLDPNNPQAAQIRYWLSIHSD